MIRAKHVQLCDLEPGRRARIVRVEGERGFRRRLLELGLMPGTEVALLRRGGLGGLVDVRARSSRLSVRAKEARGLWVEPL